MRGHSTAETDVRDAWRLGQSCPHPQTSRVEARGTAPDTPPVPARCLFSFGSPTVNTGEWRAELVPLQRPGRQHVAVLWGFCGLSSARPGFRFGILRVKGLLRCLQLR